MSERTQVVVEFPLARVPNRDELRSLCKQGFGEAKKIVGPGRVLGIVSTAVATDRNAGGPVLLVKYAVDAPEAIQPQRPLTVAT